MQDINLTLIRYFVTLVECGQFVKAAKKISISQPALSKSILTLEEQLGTSLIKHTRRSFSLTDDGKYFLNPPVISSSFTMTIFLMCASR